MSVTENVKSRAPTELICNVIHKPINKWKLLTSILPGIENRRCCKSTVQRRKNRRLGRMMLLLRFAAGLPAPVPNRMCTTTFAFSETGLHMNVCQRRECNVLPICCSVSVVRCIFAVFSNQTFYWPIVMRTLAWLS